MFKVFSLNVYALLDPDTTLSFVIPLIAKRFEILPDILHETFLVSTPMVELVVCKRVYQRFFENRKDRPCCHVARIVEIVEEEESRYCCCLLEG